MSSPNPRRFLHSKTFTDRTSLDALAEYTKNKLENRERLYTSATFSGTPTAKGIGRSHSPSYQVQCCCDEPTCEARARNTAVVSELEENVQTAAQLGQALLRQADEAEKIRSDMASKISALEEQNKHLEYENTISIERNRDLLNNLENLNESVTQADSKVRDLTADLDDTRAELDRVSARAARAEILEAQLTVLETEQEDLRRHLSSTLDEERNVAARLQKTERLVADLQEEYNKLETEYMQEKVKTQRLASKISSRKSIRDLHFPASKMEGAAISNFMKEILQDNQQLQAGTAELRQMLIIAQDEIGSLRDQVMHASRPEPTELGRSPLSYEFDGYNRKLSQELHVHHHHHVMEKKGSVRKVKRRNKGSKQSAPQSPMPPGWGSYEASGSQSKRSSLQSSMYGGHARSSSVPNTVVSETAPSTYRNSSIFDGSFNIDDSRPTSAGSMGPGMPMSPISVEKRRSHGRHLSGYNNPPFSALNEEDFPDSHDILPLAEDSSPSEEIQQAVSTESANSPQFNVDTTPTNEEDNDDITDAFDLSTPSPFLATTIPGRKLVRSTSHESLLIPETAPIDIFSAQKGSRAPIAISSNSSAFGTLQAVMTPVTARNTPARYSSTTYNRLLLSSVGGANPKSPPKQQKGYGSWFWGRFGSKNPSPETATSSLARHVEVADDSSITTVSENAEAASIRSAASSIKNQSLSSSPARKGGLRPPMGLMPRKSAPVVLATPVDEDALAEVLAE